MRLNLIYKDCWVLYIALFVLLLPVFLVGFQLIQETGGFFSFPRDEAFLQLSTAKTLAFTHVWGIDKHHFEAAGPSLLYPSLLAIPFFIFGAHLVIVPIVNTVFAIILLVKVQRWLANRFITARVQLIILLAIILLTPLPLIVIYGMEKTLLLLFAFLFVSRISDEWPKAQFSRDTLIYGALLVATRYDGFILVAVVFILLLFRQRLISAFTVALCSLTPVVIFGFFSLKNGSFFVPNIFIVEPINSQFSYDWLIGCGIAVAAPLLPSMFISRHSTPIKWGGVVVVVLLLTRNVYALRETGRSSLRIYKQEFPVGEFLHRYYSKYCMASDNIGLVSYLMEGEFVDLSGIANNRIARGKVENFPIRELLRQATERVYAQIGVISDQFNQPLPTDWIKIASWQIPGYGLSPIKKVSFYALDTISVKYLKANLVDYNSFLPQGFKVQYFY